MEKLKNILHKISEILLLEEAEENQKWKRGEYFNIFEILGLSTKEVRLHSAFLAELLNPQGSHGLGDKFLSKFINDIIKTQIPTFSFDIPSASVYVEYDIGGISEDYTEGGRIDILLQDGSMNTIIIENKIYAKDQYLQLCRYNNYAKNTLHLPKENYVILYLTLEGTVASENSIGIQTIDYYPVSYRNDIMNWIDSCICISSLFPIVRETIFQYKNNLKNILNIMNDTNLDNVLDILTETDNIDSTFTIIKQQYKIFERIRSNFIRSLSDTCSEMGFSVECDEGVAMTQNNNWIHIYDQKYSDVEFRIGVISHTNYDGYRMCFVSKSGRKPKTSYRFWQNKNPLDEFPFGWTYLWGEDGESGRWWRWDDLNTLIDMANGKMLAFIKNQLQRIKEENVFEKMNTMLS